MILKFVEDDGNDEEVYLFDATADLGVSLNKWSTVRHHIGGNDTFYTECVYRKVEFNRKGLGMVNLEKFLDESIGKQYSLTFKKIM